MAVSRILIITIILFLSFDCVSQPSEDEMPIRYIGNDHTSNSDYQTGYHDGQVRPAIGVQNYQVMRANRSYPQKSDGLGWTYNHAPNLAYWNDRFYYHYLSNPVGEHIPPGITLLVTSGDGKNWDQPKVLFPIYFTADSNAAITYHFMHQRMGFYVAPSGRLLAMGFYGDPYGEGIGRVVREIKQDGSFGPIYFIKMSEQWEGERKFPFYTMSTDSSFVEACNAFLNDKVRRMQWWEENRVTSNSEDFFRVPGIQEGGEIQPAQAFAFYSLHDSTIIGLFKGRWVTTSSDYGNTWTQPVQSKSLTYRGAKIWGQRTDDGRYALVYNPTDGMARHPLSIATSEDGINFDNLLNVQTEVPTKRFWGAEKRPGPQYVRGIVEGNGNPPGDDLWVVYSVTKEDMWISRIPVPVIGQVSGAVNDDFNLMEVGGVVTDWNIYSPQWCPVEVTKSPDSQDKVLMLKDFDPFDYAKAVRVFQPSEKSSIGFQMYIDSNLEVLAIEVVSANGARCIQTEVNIEGALFVKNGNNVPHSIATLPIQDWVDVEIDIDAKRNNYDLLLGGKKVAKNLRFSAEGIPERIIFRTGQYRQTDDVQKFKSGDKYTPGWDEPNADEVAPEAVFYIKDFKVNH